MDRWRPGHWMGKTTNSDEHIVALSNGHVIRARLVREQAEQTRWSELRRVVPVNPAKFLTTGVHNADKQVGMESCPPPPPPPLRPDDDTDDDTRRDEPVAVPADGPEPPDLADQVEMRGRTNNDEVRKHGFLPDCKGCKRVQSGLRTRGG